MDDGIAVWWSDYERSLRRRGRAAGTLSVYDKAFRRFWSWAAAEGIRPDPGAITRHHVNRYLEYLQDGDLKPATVRILWSNVKPFFAWWAKEENTTSPFVGADPPPIIEEAPDVLSIDDVRRLLATCEGRTPEERRDNAIIRVLFDTGARLGELVGLQVADWDRSTDTLMLDGKTGPRRVQLSPATAEALSRWLRVRGQYTTSNLPALWIGKKGTLTDSGCAQLLARRCDQAGLERVNPHRFRHTFAHLFRVEGGSEGDLLYLAGWKSPQMAHRYGRSAAAERARASARTIALGDRL